MNDEIMQEVWKAKDELAARHNHDVRSLSEYLRNKEKTTGHIVIDLHARQGIKRRTMPPTVS